MRRCGIHVHHTKGPHVTAVSLTHVDEEDVHINLLLDRSFEVVVPAISHGRIPSRGAIQRVKLRGNLADVLALQISICTIGRSSEANSLLTLISVDGRAAREIGP